MTSRLTILLAANVALFATCAAAALPDATRKQAAVFAAMVDCRSITDDRERLACYDRTVPAIAAAERNGDIVVADKTQVRETKKALFGFGAIRLPLFGGDDTDMPSQIEAKIIALRDMGYGKYEFTLDNNMRWRQTDDDSVYPTTGLTVTIKTAAMGSYMMKVKSRTIRVMRIR